MNLEINNLSKRYKGDIWGLKDFSLNIKSGVLGLLGPNGAGKSTLMQILATITRATEGDVLWNGTNIANDPNGLRKTLGYLPQDFGVYPNLNAVEFLTYLAAARGIGGKNGKIRIKKLLEIVNLSFADKRSLGSLSGGMRQRVGIAQALLNDPKLLIVDEPTAGLDPEERVRFRNLLSELAGDRIVILSSHIVSDVEATASSIAIINDGRLLTHLLPEELLSKVEGKVWDVVLSSDDLVEAKQKYIIGSSVKTSEGTRLRIVADEAPVNGAARSISPTLEDAYLYILHQDRNGKVQ